MNEGLNKRVVLAVATMGSFLTPFMGSSINMALPSMGKELTMSAIMLGWVAMAFQLAAAVALVPFGRMADIYGRKAVFFWGVASFTLSTVLCGLSNTAELLIFARFFQGIGGAMMFGTSAAILASTFPPEKRGAVLGINITAVYIGLVAGPSVGGILTQYLGWRSIFFAIVPLSLIVVTLILWKMKGEWADARGERFDLKGSILYVISLLMMTYGFSTLTSLRGMIFAAIGTFFLALFGLWELKCPNPILDLRIFTYSRAFTFSNLAALFNYMATFAVGFLLSLYLQYIKGLSPKDAGLILVIQPLVMALFSPLAGKLSDHMEPRLIASTGMAVTTIGLLTLALLNTKTELVYICTSLLIVGLGFAFFASPNMNAALSSVDRKIYGVASGTLATMRIIGQMLSMGITLLAFALFMGHVQITPAYFLPFLQSLRTTFVIFSILCFIGIFASLARGKVRQ